MARITKRLADAAAPAASDFVLWDDELPGFGLRVYPSGAKNYLAQWKRDGRTRRLRLGRHGPITAEEARRKALNVLAEVERGNDPAAERDARKADITVAELCEQWLGAGCPKARPGRDGRACLKPGTAADYRSAIARHILPLLGPRKLASLKAPDIARFQADVMAGRTAKVERTGPRGKARVTGGPAIAGRTTAYLASILGWAVRHGYLAASPAAGVALIPSVRRERHLSAVEMERLGTTLAEMEAEGGSPWFVAALRLLALTGCRKGEALGLRWRDVDMAAGCLRLPDSKTGARIVPLSSAARAVLAGLPITRKWVFPAARGGGHAEGLQHFWSRVRDRAGLDGATIHCLRHGFATAAVAGGASLYLTGKVLGHAQARTTERYSHAALDPVAAVAEAASARIAASLGAGAARAEGRPGGDVVALRRAR